MKEIKNQRIEIEERRKAVEKLLQDLKAEKYSVPKGFINRSIRELRDARG
jgi:hypothetical protein